MSSKNFDIFNASIVSVSKYIKFPDGTTMNTAAVGGGGYVTGSTNFFTDNDLDARGILRNSLGHLILSSSAGSIITLSGTLKFPDGTTQSTAGGGGVSITGSVGEGYVAVFSGSDAITGTDDLFWDRDKPYFCIGGPGVTSSFPYTRALISYADTGQVESTNVYGLVVETPADAAILFKSGVGILGIGQTVAPFWGVGVVGAGAVQSSADTGTAVGLWGEAVEAHASGPNTALFLDAASGSVNQAIHIRTGDIESEKELAWTIKNNQASAFSFSDGTDTWFDIDTTTDSEQIRLEAPLLCLFSSSITNAATYPLKLHHVTDGNMANNFGVGMKFLIEDSSSGEQEIAAISTTRQNFDDNKGALRLFTNDGTNSTSLVEALVIDYDQNVYLVTDTDARFLKIGHGRSGASSAYINLVGDTNYTTYGMQIIRYGVAAPNSESRIGHRGTGVLRLFCQDAGGIAFNTSGVERFTMNSNGDAEFKKRVQIGYIVTQTAQLDVSGSIACWANGSVDEGILMASTFIDSDTSSRISFIENDNETYGFTVASAGSANPEIGGRTYTLVADSLNILYHSGSTTGAVAISIDQNTGYVGIGSSFNANRPNSIIEIDMPTSNLELVDSGTSGGTNDGWIEVEIGGATRYIRVYTSK